MFQLSRLNPRLTLTTSYENKLKTLIFLYMTLIHQIHNLFLILIHYKGCLKYGNSLSWQGQDSTSLNYLHWKQIAYLNISLYNTYKQDPYYLILIIYNGYLLYNNYLGFMRFKIYFFRRCLPIFYEVKVEGLWPFLSSCWVDGFAWVDSFYCQSHDWGVRGGGGHNCHAGHHVIAFFNYKVICNYVTPVIRNFTSISLILCVAITCSFFFRLFWRFIVWSTF